MADLKGKLPTPPKKTRKKLVGEAPKLSDRAPAGSFMNRGVTVTHAPTVESDETVNRGRIQPAGNAQYDESWSHKNREHHPFSDSSPL